MQSNIGNQKNENQNAFDILTQKLYNDKPVPIEKQSNSFFKESKFPTKLIDQNVQKDNIEKQMKYQQPITKGFRR